MPATTKKTVQPSNTIEFQRQVINDIATDIHSVFTGTAAINAASIQVAGSDIGTISDVDDKTLFFYYGGFDVDYTIGSPAKLAEIYSHEDATVDIDDTITVTIENPVVVFEFETDKLPPSKLVEPCVVLVRTSAPMPECS